MSGIKKTGGSTSAGPIGATGKKSAPARVGGAAGAFASSLESISMANVISQLESVMNEIDRQAKELQKQKTFHSLKRYKDLVRKFMKTVTENLYVIKGSEVTDSTGRQKVLKTVQEVESSLEELTSRVLGSDRENVDILANMDDIRGMLVDLKG